MKEPQLVLLPPLPLGGETLREAETRRDTETDCQGAVRAGRQELRGRRPSGRRSGPAPQREDGGGEPQIMAPCALTTGRPFCNNGKEEARLIKEVPVTVGVGGFGEGPHPPPYSEGAWSSLLVLRLPQGPPKASRLALRALPVFSPRRRARPSGYACCCPCCCCWRLCRLVSGRNCPALPGTPGRGCGWVCVEGSPGVAGLASHPQQTKGGSHSAGSPNPSPSCLPQAWRGDHAGQRPVLPHHTCPCR